MVNLTVYKRSIRKSVLEFVGNMWTDSFLQLREEFNAISEKAQLLTQISEELQTTINDQQTVIEKYQEDGTTLIGSSDKDTRVNRHDLTEKREEIAGLK